MGGTRRRVEGPSLDEHSSDWVLAAVFSLLPDTRSLCRCARVCRRWSAVIRSQPSLWLHLTHAPATLSSLRRMPQHVAGIDLSRLPVASVPRAVATLFKVPDDGGQRALSTARRSCAWSWARWSPAW
eukprot:m51a1_g8726 hypothetical protein (127) ;mRNA; r:486-920